MGWLIAAPLFFISFLMSRDQHTQRPIYQNTREYFFKQSSQQSNRVIALSVQSAGSDQQVRMQTLSRQVDCLCVCLVAFYLSLHCSRVSLRAHPLPFHISDHGAISLTYFIFNYQIVFLYTALSSSPLVFHLKSSRSIKKLRSQC